ncbi:MAG: hypothetical protein BJ554DRAFT_6989 [Olpidium bornovanus]|uniref:DDE-1 domain-containing protein n=1 Tax=Olpidium bornovanus TaxID=278681 RepID=A0A8H8A1W0_9FUNG|nr:MAG: hypothetical protein BJ554DRAFT_6989 [Olpidium bornovanus]
MQADISLATKQLEGRKVNKERLTLAVCCNGDGSDKVPLWVVGKSKSPRCFKKYQHRQPWLQKSEQRKSLDDTGHFSGVAEGVRQPRMVDRNVLLVLDNCNAHIPLVYCGGSSHASYAAVRSFVEGGREIRTVVFRFELTTCRRSAAPRRVSQAPTRVSPVVRTYPHAGPFHGRRLAPPSRLSPRGFRRGVRWRAWAAHAGFPRIAAIVSTCLPLPHFEGGFGDPEKISVLDAIRMVVPAWENDVQSTTIANCFLHCNIRTGPGVHDQVAKLRYRNPMDVRSLLNYPDEEVVAHVPTLDNIIDDQLDDFDQDKNPTNDEDDNEEIPRISSKEVQQAIQTLELFWLQQEGDNRTSIIAVQQIKEAVSAIKTRQMVQTNIQSYIFNVLRRPFSPFFNTPKNSYVWNICLQNAGDRRFLIQQQIREVYYFKYGNIVGTAKNICLRRIFV